MASRLVRVLLRLSPGSEEELGDVLEDYGSGSYSRTWLIRQIISTVSLRHKRKVRNGRTAMLSGIFTDIRYATRSLRLTPSFTVAAIVTIALGVGLNTGIFTILNGLVLRDLGVPSADELISLSQDFDGGPRRRVHGARRMFSLPEYQTYRDGIRTISGLIGYSFAWPAILDTGVSQEVYGKLVTCNYFDVLQQRPTLGPGFTPTNCEAQTTNPVVILDHDLWVNAFASDPQIANKSVTLNGHSFAVVGVAPKGFHGIEREHPAFFAPVWTGNVVLELRVPYSDPNLSWLMMLGRRKEGSTLEQVRADLQRLAGRIDEEQGRRTTIQVQQATPFYVPGQRRTILTMSAMVLAAFGLVLLIACANVANLFLSRTASRSKEIAIRLSVGATRLRLMRLLLTESMLVAFAGGALGSALALWSFRGVLLFVMSRLSLGDPPLAIDTSPDIRVFAFAAAVTFVTGILFGLLPSWQASRFDAYAGLKQNGVKPGRWAASLRHGLAGIQIAICMVLLVATGLLIQGLVATHNVEPGFKFQNVAVASFEIRDEAQAQQLMEKLGSLPDVAGVAQSMATPFSRGRTQSTFRMPNQSQFHEINFNVVSRDYFSLLEIPIVRGDNFDPVVPGRVQHAVIVTEATARRFWPGQDAIGQSVLLHGPQNESSARVIGIARDAQLGRIGEIDSNYFYLPASLSGQSNLSLLVRSRGEPAALTTVIRDSARQQDSTMKLRVMRLEDNLTTWQALSSSVTALSAALGSLALLLALVGLYGVVSYAVNQRIREFGIRLALGATRGEVLWMLLRQMMRTVFIGMTIGLAAAAAVSRLLQSFLFGVSPLNPIAFMAAAFALLTMAGIASLLPSWRALKHDPIATLRYE